MNVVVMVIDQWLLVVFGLLYIESYSITDEKAKGDAKKVKRRRGDQSKETW